MVFDVYYDLRSKMITLCGRQIPTGHLAVEIAVRKQFKKMWKDNWKIYFYATPQSFSNEIKITLPDDPSSLEEVSRIILQTIAKAIKNENR